MIDNRIISSFLLFLDYQIQAQGLSYVNASGLFYPALSDFAGLYAYTCPYKQLCNDTSISGATILSGVYLNGGYTSVGQNHLVAINHYDGALYFNQKLLPSVVISGNFAIKDFSVYLSDQPDYKVLFDSKYAPNPKYGNDIPNSGVALEAKTAPAVILVVKDQEQKPLAFGGIDDNTIRIRAIAVCDTLYQKIAICNILKNFRLKGVPIPAIGAVPFDYLGNYTGLNYNYTGLSLSPYYIPLITKAKAVELPEKGEYVDIKKQIAIVDFEISTWAGHS